MTVKKLLKKLANVRMRAMYPTDSILTPFRKSFWNEG